MNKFYVYCIFSSYSEEVLYVGKGSGDRIKTSLARLMKKYDSYSLEAKKLFTNLTEEDALKKETQLIAEIQPRENKISSWVREKEHSMSKHKSLEVINGELLVFGEKLPRHPEFPWLFSATHLHKFCEKAIRATAVRNKKDPDKFFAAKRPGPWLQSNVLGENNAEWVAYWAKYTRRRIKKYGPNLGFSTSSKQDAVSDLETICRTAKGKSTTIVQGTYFSIPVLLEYATSFSIPDISEDFHKLFPSSPEKISYAVKKLSSTRKELEFNNYLAGLAQHHKAHLETQRPELGKYKVDFCFKSKSHGIWFIEFDENYHMGHADEDLFRWKEIQNKYRSMDNLPNCGLFFTRVKEGDEYAFLAKFSEYLVSGCLDRLSFIHIASK